MKIGDGTIFKYWQRSTEFNFDSYWTDGSLVEHSTETLIWNGNVYNGKSNLAGNELPWYTSNLSIESASDEKPYFKHNGNSINRKYNPSDENQWYLNNTHYLIAAAGQYHIDGESVGLGSSDNGVSGNFSTLRIDGDINGLISVHLNGVMVHEAPLGATIFTETDASPIVVNNPNEDKIKINVKNLISVMKSGAKFVPPIKINSGSIQELDVFHSWVSNQEFDVTTPVAFSYDRLAVDPKIEWFVKGYGQ